MPIRQREPTLLSQHLLFNRQQTAEARVESLPSAVKPFLCTLVENLIAHRPVTA